MDLWWPRDEEREQRISRAISPLRVGDEVEVVGMASEEECAHEMFVLTRTIQAM